LNKEEKDLEFLSNLSRNDTLQRFKRDRKINNDLKQYQQPSSSDEQDLSPIRPADENIPEPVIIQKQIRASSVEANINLPKPPPAHSQITGSYDSNQVHIYSL
jgi:hypothetical protein